MGQPEADAMTAALGILLGGIYQRSSSAQLPVEAILASDFSAWDPTELLKTADALVNAIELLRGQIHTVASDMRYCANAASGFRTPPPEVFIRILRAYAQGSSNYAASLERLRLVSRHWRDVIEGSPDLWDTIDVGDPLRIIELVLRRSKNALLTIEGNGIPALWDRRCIEVLASSSHRWQSVQLDTDVPFESLFQGQTPVLKEVHLRALPIGRQLHLNISLGHSFQHVHLTGVHLPWNSPRLSAISTLYLESLSHPPSTQQLAQFISASPQLQVLHLEDFGLIPNIPGAISQPQTPIYLPHLVTLVATRIPEPYFLHLISRFRIGSTCQVFEIGGGRDFPGLVSGVNGQSLDFDGDLFAEAKAPLLECIRPHILAMTDIVVFITALNRFNIRGGLRIPHNLSSYLSITAAHTPGVDCLPSLTRFLRSLSLTVPTDVFLRAPVALASLHGLTSVRYLDVNPDNHPYRMVMDFLGQQENRRGEGREWAVPMLTWLRLGYTDTGDVDGDVRSLWTLLRARWGLGDGDEVTTASSRRPPATLQQLTFRADGDPLPRAMAEAVAEARLYLTVLIEVE